MIPAIKQCKNPNCDNLFEAVRNAAYCSECKQKMRTQYLKEYRTSHKADARAYMQEYRKINPFDVAKLL